MLLLSLAACEGLVDAAAETDVESTGVLTSTTDLPDTTSDGGANTTGTPTTAVDTTGDVNEESGSTAAETGSFIDRPDGGTTPAGICVGLTEIGYMATVHGADDVDPTCNTRPASCGGDIVGTWSIQSHCGLDVLSNFFAHDCPESTMSFLASDVAGTRTFADDGTFAIDTSLVLDVSLELDTAECFGLDCETFGSIIDEEDNNVAASCSVPAEGGTCTCLMTITSDRSDDGTWELTDEAIVLTVDGQSGDPIPFCVGDDSLELWETLHDSRAYPDTPCTDASDCADALGDAYEEWLCVD